MGQGCAMIFDGYVREQHGTAACGLGPVRTLSSMIVATSGRPLTTLARSGRENESPVRKAFLRLASQKQVSIESGLFLSDAPFSYFHHFGWKSLNLYSTFPCLRKQKIGDIMCFCHGLEVIIVIGGTWR